MENIDLAGTRESRYGYKPGGSRDTKVSVHDMDVAYDEAGGFWVASSRPNEERSVVGLKLFVEDDMVAGMWQEATSPNGQYKGAIFVGSVVFHVSTPDFLDGKWNGFNSARTQIKTGGWVLERKE